MPSPFVRLATWLADFHLTHPRYLLLAFCAAALLLAVHRGAHHDLIPLLAGVLSSGEVWRRYRQLLLIKRTRPATIDLYDVVLHDFWDYLTQRGLEYHELRPDLVDDWLRRPCHKGKRSAGAALSEGSQNTYGHIIKRIYKLLVDRGWLEGPNPLMDWQPPPRPGRRPRALPVSSVGDLLVELGEQRRLQMMVLIGYYQGLRVGEMVRLRVGDLALAADPPSIRIHGKGGVEDWMPISPTLLPALRGWLVHLGARHDLSHWSLLPDHTPIIPNLRDPALPLSAKRGAVLLARAMRPVVGDSGHALRHTYATQLRRLTRDPFLVKDALRHRGFDTLGAYVGQDPELLAAALAQLPKLS